MHRTYSYLAIVTALASGACNRSSTNTQTQPLPGAQARQELVSTPNGSVARRADALPPAPVNPAPVDSAPVTAADPGPTTVVAVPQGADPAARPVAGRPVATTLAQGTPIRVRLEQSVDTRTNRPGDKFIASLAEPIESNGVVIPTGTRFQGHLTEAKRSGRLKGRAILGLELDTMQFRGSSYNLRTAVDTKVSKGHLKRNVGWIGGVAGVGSLIGGLAAGPAGALAGAGAGAGAGTAGAFLTGKKDVRLPVESLLTFRLRTPVSL